VVAGFFRASVRAWHRSQTEFVQGAVAQFKRFNHASGRDIVLVGRILFSRAENTSSLTRHSKLLSRTVFFESNNFVLDASFCRDSLRASAVALRAAVGAR
jgi:hypothetical protein